MKHILIIILTSVLLFSCKKHKEEIKKEDAPIVRQPKEVVMIFGQRTYEQDTLRASNGSYTVKRDKPISYTDSKTFEKIFLEPQNVKTQDTIVIPTDKPLAVNHRYHFYYDSSYLFNVGDTVVFNYRDDAPYVSVINRPERNYNIEVNYNLTNKVYKGRIEFYYEANKRFRNKQEREEYQDVLKRNIVKKEEHLDSLHRAKKTDSSYYSFLKNNYAYKNNLIHSKYDTQNVELNNDELLLLQSYRHFLNSFTVRHFDIQYFRKGSQNLPDYLALYDSIANSNLFSPKIKNHLLYTNFRNIITNYDEARINTYFKKFKQDVKDTMLVNKITEDFLLDYASLKTESANVNVVNIHKERKTLDEIIAEYKGKIVYVDFWASWCAPCREAMPDSKKLIKEFEDKDIVFLYISIDSNFKSWKKAIEDENIEYYKHSVLVINYPKATFFKNLQLKTIPRYIIFDADGKLAHKNAPSPSSNEVRDILNEFILNE